MKRDKFLPSAAAIILLFNLLADAIMLIIPPKSIDALDLVGQRRLCAYVLRGVDPFPFIGTTPPPLLTDVGSIPQNFGTSPWGLVLGNIFYPAFLPVELAAYYLFALSAITLAVTAFIVFNETKKFSSRLGKLSIALFILPAPFIISLYWGNAGSILCCLLLIGCVECDRRPILTGILLSLAMIKPQTALPFCILFLLQRRYKILLTAAAIDLGAWLIASALTATSPLTLLIEMLNANVGGGGQFTGVMMPFFMSEPSKAMYLSMIVGVLFIVLMHRRSTEKNFLSMYPAAVAALFWSYSMNNEHFILILPTLCCFFIMLELESKFDRAKWLAAGVIFYCSLTAYILLNTGYVWSLFNRIIECPYGTFVGALMMLRVAVLFVFIEMALCISRRLAALRR